MAPTNLSIAKRKLEETENELRSIKKRQHSIRAQQSRAPTIGEFWLPIVVGPQTTRINIHSCTIPDSTLAYLDTRRMPQCPIFISLPEECPDMVELYRSYLYTGKIFSQRPDDQDADEVVTVHPDREWSRLANMFLLGQKFQDERFANKVIDAFVEKVEEDPDVVNYPTGLASEVYGATRFGDGMRKLIVDLHVWAAHGKGIDEPNDDAHSPPEFLRDVLYAMTLAGKAIYAEDVPAPWERSVCKHYHVHTNTTLCAEEEAEVVDLTNA